MYRNTPYRGVITVQTHAPGDVIAQLPIGEHGTVQTDELEHDLVPAPSVAGIPTANLPAFLQTYYAQRYADFDMSQGEPHLFAGAPGLSPLDVDVRNNKTILIQYHDRSNVGADDSSSGFLDPFLVASGGFRNLTAYEVTVILQIEEAI